MNSKLIGGILLIIGTSIGGGMLALPIATASTGFLHSVLFLVLCWFIMTSGALLLLEVNLHYPQGSNIVSMASHTLGRPGKVGAWFSYLFLLYTLLSAYISGGTDILLNLLKLVHIQPPTPLATLLYVIALGAIVFAGMRIVDYVNRGLMLVKFSILFLLLIIITPQVSLPNLPGGQLSAISSALMILITSYGFASIVPSLRDYFDNDINKLRKVIIIGSLVPLFCYIAWDAVIMSVVPQKALAELAASDNATSGLTTLLQSSTNSLWLLDAFRSFAVVCMLTAFLGVSIGLFDFIADGLKLKKHGIDRSYTALIAYLPPLLIVLFYPGAYLHALKFAGLCCVVLLLLLPALMAYNHRYKFKHSLSETVQQSHTQLLPGGKTSLIAILFLALSLLTFALFHF